jgi:hypothetical protein
MELPATLGDLLSEPIIETQAASLLACLKAGTVSTNIHVRKLHNFCLGMNWLPWPIVPKRLWPEVKYETKRATRNGRPTIYGPRAACCFTEMPLYALLHYASARADSAVVDYDGVALLKSELFAARWPSAIQEAGGLRYN